MEFEEWWDQKVEKGYLDDVRKAIAQKAWRAAQYEESLNSCGCLDYKNPEEEMKDV